MSASTSSKSLVEIAAFPPPMGAWSQRIEFVAEQWRGRGHECILLNIGPSRKLRNPTYCNVRGILDYLFKVTIFAVQGHVLHTHTNAKGVKGNLLALAAHFISCLRGRRCALTFHAGVRQEYFPKTGNWLKDTLLSLTFKTARLIICNNAEVKQKIVEGYGIAEEKVFPIQAFCAAYMRQTPTELPENVQEFARQHAPLLISYVFFFHPEFAVDDMLQAVARLRQKYPQLGLVIMGSQQYAENYQALIQELELGSHLLLTGNLPRDQFLGVLKHGDLYLRTPMGDGVAASVLEALALGTPVVASDNGARPPSCVLYRERDVDDMVKQIERVLANHAAVTAAIIKPDDRDTVSEEVDLLLSIIEERTPREAALETNLHA